MTSPGSNSSHSSPSRPRGPLPSTISRQSSAIHLGPDSLSNQVDRPPVSATIRMPSGIASARVGLGSPKLIFNRDWARGRRNRIEEIERASVEEEAIAEEAAHFLAESAAERQREERGLNGLVDRVSGLPSPPRTESGIALLDVPARGFGSRALAEMVLLRSRSASPVEDPVDTSHTSRRHSSSRSARSASHHSPSTFSPSFEQKAESPVPRRAPRPKPSPSFSHSSSSSSKLASTDGNGLGIENGHSPSPPIEQPRSGSSTNRRGSGPADIAANPNKSADEDLDERIRFAEEQIQRTHALQARRTLYPEQGISPEEAKLRSRDAGTLEFDSPAAASGSTLRRSGTTSSASARTPNGDSVYRDQTPEDSYVDEREKERSNGSGGGRLKPLPHSFRHGGFFTPSPKPSKTTAYTPNADSTSARSPRMQQYESPIPYNNYSPVPSRFATTAPLPRELDSVPSSSTYRDYSRTSRFEGLDFSSSINDDRVQGRRQWGESAIGLPRARDPLDDRGLPFPRTTLHGDKQRAESVVGTTAERNLYSLLGGRIESALAQRFGERGAKSLASKRDSGSPNSRINLTPADSVSVVGMRSERAETVRKDPLEILKRIEAERSEHNRQWEVKRAESALGDRDIPRSISRFEHTPQHARPATSMSNLRDQHAAPRTAPAERQRRLLDEIDSPLRDRVSSRMSHVLYPSSEPRPMRSSTSLGGQAPVHLDPSSATTGHGRLLFEAFQSLATKLQSEMSGTVTSFYSATRTSESVNTSVHAALQLAAQISIEIEVDPALVRDQLARLIALLRETSRASDQNVRDQTGIMLDLPKALPAVNGSRMNNDIPRRWRPSSPSTYEYPIGRSAEMVRPATSIGDCCSPSKRFSRDVAEASMTASRDRLPSNMSPYISAVHGLASTPRRDELPPIEASPPVTFSSTQSHDHVPAPASPEQPRKVLRKKASTTSTNTVRGSTFLPSASKIRTTTAISVITAGDNSPSKARSISSQRSSLWDEHGQGEPSSPTSRFSFHTAESRDHDESDAVSLLAQAAKNRDVGKWGGAVGLGKAGGRGEGGNENGRRPSVSERFRATLRRNPGSEPA